jgi:hypothetical protein
MRYGIRDMRYRMPDMGCVILETGGGRQDKKYEIRVMRYTIRKEVQGI